MKDGPDNRRESSLPPGRRSDLRELGAAHSERRPAVVANFADRWLDDLLQLSVRLGIEQSPHDIVRACIDEGVRLLPGCEIGVCMVDPVSGEQQVERHLPPGTPKSHDESRPPSRSPPSCRWARTKVSWVASSAAASSPSASRRKRCTPGA